MNERYDGEPGVSAFARGGRSCHQWLAQRRHCLSDLHRSVMGEEFAELGERDRVQSGPSWYTD